MSSKCFKTSFANFLKSTKEENKSTNFKTLEQNKNIPISTTVEQNFRNSESSNVYMVIETNECSVTVATKNRNSTPLRKNEKEDVIVIDISDDSDTDEIKYIDEKKRENTQNENYSLSVLPKPPISRTSPEQKKLSSDTSQCSFTASANQPLTLTKSSGLISEITGNDQGVSENKKRTDDHFSDGNNYCKFCKRTHLRSKDYHRDYQCPFQSKYQIMCKLCGEKYLSESSLRFHLKTVHLKEIYQSGYKTKLDKIVKKTKLDKMPLDGEKRDCTAKKFMCKYCDREFDCGLKFRKFHEEICQAKSFQKHHSVKSTNLNSETTHKHAEKFNSKIQCDLCGQCMPDSIALEIHKHGCKKAIDRQLEEKDKVNNGTEILENGSSYTSSEITKFQVSSIEKESSKSESSEQQLFSEFNNCENISRIDGNQTSINVSELGYVIPQKRKRERQLGLSDKYCKFCKMSFVHSHKYYRHRDFHCPSQRKFQAMCKLCGKKYTQCVPYSHLNKVHNIKYSKNRTKFEVIVPIDDKKSIRSKKRFRCEYCDGLFVTGLKARENHFRNCLKINCPLEILQIEKSRDGGLNSKTSYNQGEFQEKFRCNLCGQCMSGIKGLKIHKHRCRKIKKQLEQTNNVGKVTRVDNFEITEDNARNSAVSTIPTSSQHGLKCSNCNITFFNAGNLGRHLKNRACQRNMNNSNLISSEKPIFQCRFCCKKYSYGNALKHHEQYLCKHKTKLYSCSKCENRYSNYQRYKLHEKTCKNKIKKTENSNVKSNGNSSFIAITKQPFFQCYKCGICNSNDFERLKFFKKHLQSHDEVNIICTTCKFNFTKYDVFKKHLKKIFKKPFVCGTAVVNSGAEVVTDFADEVDDNIYEIDNADSIDVDNADNIDVDNADNNEVDNVIDVDNHPFACNVCNRKYSTMSLLVEHIQRHLEIEGDIE